MRGGRPPRVADKHRQVLQVRSQHAAWLALSFGWRALTPPPVLPRRFGHLPSLTTDLRVSRTSVHD
eukprot:7145558-Alexandrium_andersonii.AAC.1